MEPPAGLGERIIVVGRPGSGKSSLGIELGSVLRRTVFRLDTFVTDERLSRRPPGEVSAALEDVAREKEWILEGAPWDVPEHAWSAATAVVWLDLPRSVIAWRVFKRAFPRRLRHRRVWGLIRYTMLSDAAARARQQQYVGDFAPPHAQIVRLTRPKESRDLIARVLESTAARQPTPVEDPPSGARAVEPAHSETTDGPRS